MNTINKFIIEILQLLKMLVPLAIILFILYQLFPTEVIADSHIQPNSTSTQDKTNAIRQAQVSENEYRLKERFLLLEQRINSLDKRIDDLVNLLGLAAVLLTIILTVRQIISFNRDRKSETAQIHGVNTVNSVVDVVHKTLEHRLEQEQSMAETFKGIEAIRAQFDRVNKFYEASYESILEGASELLNIDRMGYATLGEELRKKGINIRNQTTNLQFIYMNNNNRTFDNGIIYYVCGVMAYYDNDISSAAKFLDYLLENLPEDHESLLVRNEKYLFRIGFAYYFRALINKNWGSLMHAESDINQSSILLANKDNEYLTPTTAIEIQSYGKGPFDKCREDAKKLVSNINVLPTQDNNQIKLRCRLNLIIGNTYFVEKDFSQAYTYYSSALEGNSKNYYALFSIAQCAEEIKDKQNEAQDYYKQCLEILDSSRDIESKKELITCSVIAIIGSIAANKSENITLKDKYDKFASKMLTSIGVGGALSPKFFSPTKKVLVTSDQLLGEMG